jgi:hypothetical protein
MVSLAERGLNDARGSIAEARRARGAGALDGDRRAGRSPADLLLAAYRGPWKGDIDKIFDTQAL